MRSNSLTSGFSDTFFEDLSRFSALPEEVATEAVQLLAKATETDGIIEESAFVPLAKSHNVMMRDISRGLLAAAHLVEQARDQKDEIDEVLDDLVELGKVTDRAALKRRLRLFDGELQERLLKIRREQETISSTFPTMTYFHASVALAFSFDKNASRRKDTVGANRPEVYSAVPAIVLQFDIDRLGAESSFSFACSIKDLSDLITQLEVAKKEALAVRGYRQEP